METVGVSVTEVRTGELKAQPNFLGPPSEEALAALQAIISETYDWFVDQVVERRGIDANTIRSFEGNAFVGSAAVDNGLVDEVGGEPQAISWLSENHGIDEDMRVIDRRHRNAAGFAGAATDALVSLVRNQGEVEVSLSAQGLQRQLRDIMLLDGLLSLWHGR